MCCCTIIVIVLIIITFNRFKISWHFVGVINIKSSVKECKNTMNSNWICYEICCKCSNEITWFCDRSWNYDVKWEKRLVVSFLFHKISSHYDDINQSFISWKNIDFAVSKHTRIDTFEGTFIVQQKTCRKTAVFLV